MDGFDSEDWKRIYATLEAAPEEFGLPTRIYGSFVLGSFNIRKLGRDAGRKPETWKFLAKVCSHFDLLAVQEVLDDLSGLRRLKELMGSDFGMIVSDACGVFPGDRGNAERLAFLFNWRVVERTEVATDVTYDRSKILDLIARHNDALHEAMGPYSAWLSAAPPFEEMKEYWERHAAYVRELEAYDERVHQANLGLPARRVSERPGSEHPASERPAEPSLAGFPRRPTPRVPAFLSFIRAPFCVSFRVSGHPGTDPFEFMAVNAHLFFGDTMADRRQEFDALMDWIIHRIKSSENCYYRDFVLLGDLNLDYDNPSADRERIESRLKSFNDATGASVHVNFPFLDVHAGRDQVFRTNARASETFDQIGLFARDRRFPRFDENARLGCGESPLGPDYGVFDFVELFARATVDKSWAALDSEERKQLLRRTEYEVSDHMPLWLRMPLPVASRPRSN